MHKQCCTADVGDIESDATIRNFRIVHQADRDFHDKHSQRAVRTVVRFSRTTAAGEKIFSGTERKGSATCKQYLQVRHENAEQEYQRLSARYRGLRKSPGEAESIKALEDAAKHVGKDKKPGDGK